MSESASSGKGFFERVATTITISGVVAMLTLTGNSVLTVREHESKLVQMQDDIKALKEKDYHHEQDVNRLENLITRNSTRLDNLEASRRMDLRELQRK